MKKLLILSLCNLFTMLSFGQEFLGIKVEGTISQVVSQFEAKGFKATQSKANQNVMSMTGTVAGTEYMVNVVSTPKTKKVWKFSVYMPEIKNWYTLKREYQSYLAVLTEKYGEPKSKYDFFESPYKEGDGYEMTGVAVDKCHYAAYWEKSISIKISKFNQVNICYENEENSALDDQEKKEINNKVF